MVSIMRTRRELYGMHQLEGTYHDRNQSSRLRDFTQNINPSYVNTNPIICHGYSVVSKQTPDVFLRGICVLQRNS